MILLNYKHARSIDPSNIENCCGQEFEMKDMPGEGEGGEEDRPQEMEEQKEMS